MQAKKKPETRGMGEMTVTQHTECSKRWGAEGHGGNGCRAGGRRGRGHPLVICFGPLRAQTHREQVNQLQCDMNH